MSLQLIGTNKANSTLLAYDSSTRQVSLYSAFGSVDNAQSEFRPGFNGERPDPLSGVSHLGNGYRAYNPILMRFTCPDNDSPFGVGGINPYAYCQNDPVNFADPSGHGFIFRLIRRGLTALFKHIVEEEIAKSFAKTVAKTIDLSLTYGTQITSAITTIEGYEDMSTDPQQAILLEKIGQGFGLVNAIVTVVDNPVDLVQKLKQLESREGSFAPAEAVNESFVKTSVDLKNQRRMANPRAGIQLAIKGVTTAESSSDFIALHDVLQLGDIDENIFHRIVHGVKDVGERFFEHDFKTVEDLLQHDSDIKTRPALYINMAQDVLGLASTTVSIEAYAIEKTGNASDSDALYKVAGYIGSGGDIMDIVGNIESIKEHAVQGARFLYSARVLFGGKLI